MDVVAKLVLTDFGRWLAYNCSVNEMTIEHEGKVYYTDTDMGEVVKLYLDSLK